MDALRIVFFGTPDFAVPSLREVLSCGHVVPAVVTQPDRPRGRGQKASAAPVKAFAEARGLRVMQPDRLKGDEFLASMAALYPDLGVVAAYGKILPETVLALPRLGVINVHASLLPRWRGASPVHRAVMAGDAETGVSIMRLVRALDAGNVLACERRAIGPDETSEQVEGDLAERGARLLVATLPAIASGGAPEVPQDERLVTYAPRLTREEGLIAWDVPASAIHNQVRGLHPWPRAFTQFGGARLIVHRTALPADADPAPASARPGEVLDVRPEAIVVAAGSRSRLHVLQVQAEGRRLVTAREFAAGAHLAAGARFGA